MMYYTELSPEMRFLIAGLMFLASLMQLGLCLYKFVLWKSYKKCISDGIIYVIVFMWMAYIKGASRCRDVEYEVRLPWMLFVLVTVLIMGYVAFNVQKEYIKSKKSLSSTSIKQAFDNLNSGICFADEKGKIVLINYVMSDIIYSVLNRYPQTLSELREALSDEFLMSDKRINTSDNMQVLQLKNGGVWSFREVLLEEKSLAGYRQVTALNITELSQVNEKLTRENEHLKKVNEELKIMLENLADHIREQEILDLKMRIHNDIGTSLIAITNIMNAGSNDDNNTALMDIQLKTLKNAVSYFADNNRKRSNTLDDVVSQAREMNVAVEIKGEVSDDEVFMRIITVAVRECVTNCIRHAGGDTVFVAINKEIESIFPEHTYVVKITNNGELPGDKMSEGGGLSSLRKAVESVGGCMQIQYEPDYVLTIKL